MSMTLTRRLHRPRSAQAMAFDIAWYARFAQPVRRYNFRMLGRIGW